MRSAKPEARLPPTGDAAEDVQPLVDSAIEEHAERWEPGRVRWPRPLVTTGELLEEDRPQVTHVAQQPGFVDLPLQRRTEGVT